MTNSLQSPLRMRRKKHTYQDDSAFQKMYTKNTACILMESPQRKSRRNFVKYSEFQSFPKYGLQQSSAIADTTASITFSTHRVQCRKRKVDETSTELPILEPPNTFPTPVTDVNGVIVHQSIKRNRSNRPSHNIIDTIPVSILDNSTSLLFPIPGPFLNSEEQQFELSITHNLNGELKSQEDQAHFNFDDSQGNDLVHERSDGIFFLTPPSQEYPGSCRRSSGISGSEQIIYNDQIPESLPNFSSIPNGTHFTRSQNETFNSFGQRSCHSHHCCTNFYESNFHTNSSIRQGKDERHHLDPRNNNNSRSHDAFESNRNPWAIAAGPVSSSRHHMFPIMPRTFPPTLNSARLVGYDQSSTFENLNSWDGLRPITDEWSVPETTILKTGSNTPSKIIQNIDKQHLSSSSSKWCLQPQSRHSNNSTNFLPIREPVCLSKRQQPHAHTSTLALELSTPLHVPKPARLRGYSFTEDSYGSGQGQHFPSGMNSRTCRTSTATGIEEFLCASSKDQNGNKSSKQNSALLLPTLQFPCPAIGTRTGSFQDNVKTNIKRSTEYDILGASDQSRYCSMLDSINCYYSPL